MAELQPSPEKRISLSAPDITEAEIQAVTAVLRTARLSLGPELGRFERALAEYHGIPDAIAVSSGTAGLHLALLTLGIGNGDEVIVPSFAFIAVANAVLQAGATPIFADIDPVTLNLDPADVEQRIGGKTRAILVVHTFGVPAEMDALRTLADRHGLALIEDACEAVGGWYGEGAKMRRVGTFGDLAVLGFYPNKQLTTGEGGAVLVRDGARAERLRSLRNQGRTPNADWLDHAEIGYNYRISEMACALGRVQLGRLEEMLRLRAAVAQRYDGLLREVSGLELPALTLAGRTISWFVYVVRLPERDRAGEAVRATVQKELAEKGIATGRYFGPIHRQPAWKDHRSAAGLKLPITEGIAERTLALPFFNRISEGEQSEVASALIQAVRAL
ncbi:MAG TPA: DegT/DnrJ/EryC1/StrS family aminotransferase [Terracidiphilus sp.]|jgi:perosamine synthetase|nr:DegT/DnrJ/EryC1/StrS family aminotransferase [Terracidiphilus sp.]